MDPVERSKRCLTSPSICTPLLIFTTVRQAHGKNEKFGLALHKEDREAFQRLLNGILEYVPINHTFDIRFESDIVRIPWATVGRHPSSVNK